MKVFLIGLPGSGKSFIGQRLAQAMRLPFIDLDDAIKLREGVSVNEIFLNKGQDYFRKIEAEVLQSEMAQNEFVMATGGGAPCFFDSMNRINDCGISIFLNTATTVIADRLNKEEKDSRPLLAGETNIEQALKNLLTARLPFYSQAHITISGDSTVSEIIQSINSLK